MISPVRDIVHRLCEVGWLFRKVKTFIDTKTQDKTAGLVCQVILYTLLMSHTHSSFSHTIQYSFLILLYSSILHSSYSYPTYSCVPILVLHFSYPFFIPSYFHTHSSFTLTNSLSSRSHSPFPYSSFFHTHSSHFHEPFSHTHTHSSYSFSPIHSIPILPLSILHSSIPIPPILISHLSILHSPILHSSILYTQSFCSALSDEVTEYYRLVAVLEAQLQDMATVARGESGRSQLTLRRLIVWTHDPLQRLKYLAILVGACKGLSEHT